MMKSLAFLLLFLVKKWFFLKQANNFCCAARSAFGRRAEPELSEGGGARRSVAVPNGEGVASGGATELINIGIYYFVVL